MSRTATVGTARGLILTLGVVAHLAAAPPARAAGPSVTRVLLLPLFGRTSVVIELSEAIPHIEHSQPDATTVVIEGGPVSPGLASRKFQPLGPAPLVSAVALSAAKRADGADYFRVLITLTAQASHAVRTSGSRLYVDLSPPEPQTPLEPAKPAEEVRQAPVSDGPAKLPPAPRTSNSDEAAQKPADAAPARAAAPPKEPAKERTGADAAYRELESTTLAQARELSARPDVRGLLRLKDDVQKRDEQLGKLQPDVVNRVLDEISRLTDQARALQLERDRGSFKER